MHTFSCINIVYVVYIYIYIYIYTYLLCYWVSCTHLKRAIECCAYIHTWYIRTQAHTHTHRHTNIHTHTHTWQHAWKLHTAVERLTCIERGPRTSSTLPEIRAGLRGRSTLFYFFRYSHEWRVACWQMPAFLCSGWNNALCWSYGTINTPSVGFIVWVPTYTHVLICWSFVWEWTKENFLTTSDFCRKFRLCQSIDNAEEQPFDNQHSYSQWSLHAIQIWRIYEGALAKDWFLFLLCRETLISTHKTHA